MLSASFISVVLNVYYLAYHASCVGRVVLVDEMLVSYFCWIREMSAKNRTKSGCLRILDKLVPCSDASMFIPTMNDI